jgi:ribose transport system permease protein
MTATDASSVTDDSTRSVGDAITKRAGRSRMNALLESYALVALLVAVAVFFSLWSKTSTTFLSSANLRILIGNQVVIGIIALGALVPLVGNEWDLSVGAVAGVSSVFAASLISKGLAIPLALLCALAIGAGVGFVNATLVTKVGVNGVITTLGVATILEGINNQKTGGLAIVSHIPRSLTRFGSASWFGVPRIGLALVLVAALTYYMLAHTPVGRHLYALGSNPRAARLVGLSSARLVTVSFVLAGVLSAIGGFLQIARQGGADPRIGPGFTLPALAAAFLSAASIKPGKYNVGGTLVAIFFIATLNNGLSLAGVPAYVSSYVNGGALIIGVAFGATLGRRQKA